MIKVFEILEEEKQEAVIVARKDERAQIVENLIKAGVDTLMIMKGTGLKRACSPTRPSAARRLRIRN